MKNIYLNIFPFNKKILNKIVKLLKKNKIIGLPTETVYGLAGNAYSKTSINKIFELKRRPKNNPLIIHYFDLNRALKDIETNSNFKKLYKKFSPGPITYILKKKTNSKVVSNASANLKTIAVRFPKQKNIRSILKKLDFPLAMPSANISSKVSPVKALDVYDEFKNKLNMIIDGGRSKIGIESTVIDLTKDPKLLRPGIISHLKIQKILKVKIKTNFKISKINSPGLLKKHYSPGIPVLINQKKHDKNSAFIYLGNKYIKRKKFFCLSKKSDLQEAASNLYMVFRKIKKMGYKKIQIQRIPSRGPGLAINDRIKKAANIK